MEVNCRSPSRWMSEADAGPPLLFPRRHATAMAPFSAIGNGSSWTSLLVSSGLQQQP